MSDLISLFDPEIHIPQMLREMPCANVRKGWSDFLDQIADRCTNRDFAQGFYDAVPIASADPSEYNYRIVNVHGLRIACSLRFKALTMSEPFIEILLCDRPLDRETITVIGSIVKKEYARFQPDRVRYLSLDDSPLWPQDREDFAFFVGDISAIQSQPRPVRYDELEVLPATDLDCHEHLKRNYEELIAERGLRPESISSLQQSMDHALLYNAFLKGQWAGMLSAHRATERFYTGVFIVEEVIDMPIRGQGYAPAMQRKFIDLLEPDRLVFGEILSWNQSSRRTATRVGRKKCGTTFFHMIE